MLIEVANTHFTTHFESFGTHFYALRSIGRVIESHCAGVAVEFLYVLGKHIGVATMLHHASLKAEAVLIDCYEFAIGDNLHGFVGDISDVATQQQGRTHNAPHAEVSLLLGV